MGLVWGWRPEGLLRCLRGDGKAPPEAAVPAWAEGRFAASGGVVLREGALLFPRGGIDNDCDK